MKYILYGFLGLLVPVFSSAHVRYIADDSIVGEQSGMDFSYLLQPFMRGDYVLLMVASILFAAIIYFVVLKAPDVRQYIQGVKYRVSTYGPMISWVLRVCLGIALIGFGTKGLLLSPVLQISDVTFFAHWIAFLQILTGFFLLVGFMITIISYVVIALYLLALFADPYMIGSLDILGIAAALIILDARVPGVDHLLNIPDECHHRLVKYVPTIMRILLGIGFMFLALYEKIFNPHLASWVVHETGLMNVVPVDPSMWVLGSGITEALIAFAILIGFKVRIVSVITFLVLSLSFFYFKEDVVSHVTLFGAIGVLFVTGAGPWSVDLWLQKRRIAKQNEAESLL